jgi:hypothetical protein
MVRKRELRPPGRFASPVEAANEPSQLIHTESGPQTIGSAESGRPFSDAWTLVQPGDGHSASEVA